MAWAPFTRKVEVQATSLRGLLRQPANLILPNEVAQVADDLNFGQGVARRRLGAVRLYAVDEPSEASLVFDGTTAKYVTFPYIAPYNLLTKWAAVFVAKTDGTPASNQFLLSRDVTPTTAGKKTLGVYINSSRQIGVLLDIGGTAYNLTPSAASVVTADTKFRLLVVRDGATLSLYLDDDTTPKITRTDLPSGTPNQPGTNDEPFMVAQNYDGTSRTSAFDGTIGFISLFNGYYSAAKLLKFTSRYNYPESTDQRVILYAPFGYSQESGAVAKDYSPYANDGVVTGSPTRAASISEEMPVKVQSLFTYGDPVTGDLLNCVVAGGVLYTTPVRR